MLVYKIENNNIELIQGEEPEHSFKPAYPNKDTYSTPIRDINDVKWIGLLHGSPYSTGIMDGTKSRYKSFYDDNTPIRGIWSTSDSELALGYGDYIYELETSFIKRVLEVDCMTDDELVNRAYSEGYGAVLFRDSKDGTPRAAHKSHAFTNGDMLYFGQCPDMPRYDGSDNDGNTVVIFNNSDMKIINRYFISDYHSTGDLDRAIGEKRNADRSEFMSITLDDFIEDKGNPDSWQATIDDVPTSSSRDDEGFKEELEDFKKRLLDQLEYDKDEEKYKAHYKKYITDKGYDELLEERSLFWEVLRRAN